MQDLDLIANRLFNICRSITGPGIRQSLKIISEYMPLDIVEVKSGTKVFDWTVPKEWELIEGSLSDLDGNVLIDTKDNTMHVLNFSQSFEGIVTRDELFKSHLFSLPSLPDAIPYVTSYYKDRWGFCVSEKQKQKLTQDKFKVSIKTQKYDGALTYGHAFLQGKSDKKIVISTYLCHPNMLNNELSGPLCMILLYNMLKAQEDRYYSYEFFINPETIGSLSILATYGQKLKENLVFGMVLTCLCNKKDKELPLSFKLTRRDGLYNKCLDKDIDTTIRPYAIDKYLRFVCANNDMSIRSFDPTSGSDERQYCSANIDLPFVQASRTVYASYAEYHTSLDNKDLFSISSIKDSAYDIFNILNKYRLFILKIGLNIEGGEPQLGKRDLYPTINTPLILNSSKDGVCDNRKTLDTILNFISLCDGTLNLLEIAKILDLSFKEAQDYFKLLHDKDVIKLLD